MNLLLIPAGLFTLGLIGWRVMKKIAPEQATGYFWYMLAVVGLNFFGVILPKMMEAM